MKKSIAGFIDHTLLRPDATAREILRLCDEARRFGFASVCVNPCRVSLCARSLAGSSVAVCTVIGFPFGATTPAALKAEAAQALDDGALELDLVMNRALFKDDPAAAARELSDFTRFCRRHRRGCVLKLIIECCDLTKKEIVAASLAAKKAGFDFVKTSTGFGKGGATVADVRLIRKTVGAKTGIKAAGGVRDRATALRMIRAGATRLGCSSSLALV